jgi:hypothetical protein
LLTPDIQLGIIGGAGDHPQDAQRRRHLQWGNTLAQFQVAYYWRVHRLRQEAFTIRVEQEFPGQVSQAGRILQAQLEAQAGLGLAQCPLQAAVQAVAHRPLENRPEQPFAQLPRRRQLRRIEPPAGPAQARHPQQQVLQLHRPKGQAEIHPPLPARRAQHFGAVPLTGGADL